MDSPYSGYSVPETDLSYSSLPTASLISTRLSKSFKFGLKNSPNSPFSAHFENEMLDQQSSADNLSMATPCFNSSLNHNNNYLQQSRPFPYSLPNENNDQNIRNRLLELESALMAPTTDEDMTKSSDSFLGESSQSQMPVGPSQTCAQDEGSRSRQSESPRESRLGSTSFNHTQTEDHTISQVFSPDDLKRLLISCARALSENKLDEFEQLVGWACSSVSITGEPIQRLGAYLVEGLVARRESSGTNIYRALRCNQPNSKDLLLHMHILYEVCPYLKFGYMAANGAIAEACKDADCIHIVDFQIMQGTQWMTLLRALAARPGGPPRVRITGIDDPVSKFARGNGLAAVGRRLVAVAEKFGIPVEFHPIPFFAPHVTQAMLDVRPGEALAVNFLLQLHHTPDESVDVCNPRDGLLRMVKSLSPRVVTLVEQESNTNTAPFLPRFVETMDYYSAVFESIDVAMARDKRERINAEQHCLARDIVNIVACEGKERVERHELFGKWRLRLMMAGFRQVALSSYVTSVIRGLVRCYSEHYTLVEKDGAALLGWKGRNLVSASAWH